MNKNITAITGKPADAATAFKNLLNENENVIVDFWATWCGPCRMMSPIFDQIADERAGSLKVAKVDVDEQQQLAGMFGISSIPTIITFKNGQPVGRPIIGAKPKAAVLADIDRALGN